jgi:hypothetical protein
MERHKDWGLFKGQMDLDLWLPNQSQLDQFKQPECCICGKDAKYAVSKNDYCGARSCVASRLLVTSR